MRVIGRKLTMQKRGFLEAALILGTLIVVLVTSVGFQVHAEWPYCISNCNAKDVRVSNVYVTNISQDASGVHGDAYADFSVTARNRYCILVALDFSTTDACSNPSTVYRMFGDLSKGTYSDQYVGTVEFPAGSDLWLCRKFAEWKNRDSVDCPSGDHTLYSVGSKCWEDNGHGLVYSAPTAEPPVANNDAATTDENNPVNIDVTANDSDADGTINKTTVTITRDPQDALLGVNSSTGVVSYTPDPGFCGSDYFKYTVDDNDGMPSNEATVTVTVICNESPQAGDDAATTNEDTSVGIDVTANDTDSDGTIKRTTVTITKNPDAGSVSVHSSSGVVTYTPDVGSCDSDTFRYTIDDDDRATSNEATVTVNMLCNDPPLAIDDLYSVNEGGTLDIPASGILANDVDSPGNPLTAILISDPEHGTLSLNADGSFTYVHDGTETSGDSFTYKVNDGKKDSNAASVSIVINPTNDPLIAEDDSASTDEDGPVTIDVLANDSDPDGDTLSVDWVSQPANGMASHNGSDVTYTPNPDSHGTDTFTYTASDGYGGTATATVTVNVTAVNDPPVAQDDSSSTEEDTPVAVFVLSNDSDPDGDTLLVDWVAQPANGTASNYGSDITYTPDPDFNGTDTFTYTASDGDGTSAPATVTVTVIAVNDPPVAQDDSADANEDTSVTIRVLANDSDPDGDTLSVDWVAQPANGSAANNVSDVTYTPDPDFNGVDTFTYIASDGNGTSAPATVTVTVIALNDPPVAEDDSSSTEEDTPVTILVLSNDSDPDSDDLSVEGVTQPTNGTASNNGNNVTYIPETNFHGVDMFTYTASDGNGGMATAMVTMAVATVNDPPVAEDDSAVTNEDTPVSIGVLENDTDPDGDSLVIESSTQPLHGTTERSGTSIIYTPDSDFNGADTFTYTIADGNGGTATATVTVTVIAVNDSPVAIDDTAVTNEDTPVSIGVLANDTDPDGDSLVIESSTQPLHGATERSGTNIIYTPDSGFNGADTFTYTIADRNGGTATATVRVTVETVNDPPVAQDDTAVTNEDTPVSIGVLANDSDPDGDSLAIESSTQPLHGATERSGTNIIYTPASNFNEADTFTYTIADGNGGTATATVRVTVETVNDPPVAQDDTAVTNEDTPVSIGVLENDTDLDGDSLVIESSTQPLHGTTERSGTNIIYTPAPNFNGTDTFTYTIADRNGGTATATVSVTVTAVNDPPVAQNDSSATEEDTPVTVFVLSNDTDPDGDYLVVESITQPASGTASNNGSDITYTPNTDFGGVDTFTYTASDGNGGTATATVTVSVATVNDPPVAQDDNSSTAEDTPVTIFVLSNDADPDGDSLIVESIIQPTNGTASNNGSKVIYTPISNFNGADTFTYTASDGNGGTATATVRVTVKTVNDPPVAEDDSALTNEDTPVSIGVLENDTDLDGDSLVIESSTQPLHGTTVRSGTHIIYTPAPNFNGTDTFTYTIADGNSGTATATVRVTVETVNDPPVAQDDTAVTNEDTPVSIGVLANDSDPDGDSLAIESSTQPLHGSTERSGTNIIYTPDSDFNGADTFTYTIADRNGGTATATVRVTVETVNDPPVAQNDSSATEEDTPVTVFVLSNDTDPDGDGLVVKSVTQPASGTASNNGSDITYTPDADFGGVGTFTYTASDGNGGTATATVTVSVATVNDPPVAQDDSAVTNEEMPVSISVLSNDADPDADSLVVESITQPTNGTASNNGSKVIYTPISNFNGEDTFTYTIADGKGGTATAMVSVTVIAVNDPPVARDDNSATNENTPVTIRVLLNDADPDADSLVIESNTQPLHGSTARSGTNIIYTPASNFNGADTFTYTVTDGNGGAATATVTVDVIAVNDLPIAQDDSHSTGEDTPVTILVLSNDSDPDGDSLVVESVTQPANGAVSNNSSNVMYTPDTGFGGIDTFSYTVADGRGGTSTAKVIVAVSTTNDPPVAQDDSADTNEGTLVMIPILANDSDPDGDFLLVESFTHPTHGSVLNTKTTVSYIPDAGFSGVDTFSYTVSDGNGGTDTATVTVSVAAVNDPPVAQDDSDITDEGIPVIISVLLNDSDLDGDNLTVESVNQPENGTVSNDGTNVTYTPAGGFSGIDTFDYTVSDGKGGTDTATIIVAVAAVNDPPVAQDDSAATEKNSPVTISILANDSDPDAGDSLVVESISQPANGTLENNGVDLLYTPNEGFAGSDTFTYTVSDGRGGTDTATVTVGVSGEAGAGGAAGNEAPCDGKVIISEVAWAGTAADPRDEWIELRNLGTTPVDLSGWALRWRRTHPSTADDQTWKVVELSGVLLPASVSECDRTLQDTTSAVRFLKEDPESVSWLVSSEPDETDNGYYILERRHDATVNDIGANLLYDTSQSLSLELSDLGDVIMLLNELGDVVDTANASYLGRDGWAAGSAATYGTMERVNPLGADAKDNWQTNMGIVIDGLDARKHSLRATPGERNSPAIEDLYSEADIEPTTIRSGEAITVNFLLPKQDRRMAGWPWISVARPGFAGIAGAGGAVDNTSYSFSGRSQGGDNYVLDIGTKNLSPGEYIFWVIYGQGKAVLVPVVVTP